MKIKFEYFETVKEVRQGTMTSSVPNTYIIVSQAINSERI